jgi:light-regulated signal transduction histidine kinase (bacteriophytochrome)
MSGFARILLENYAVKLDDQGKDYLKHIQRGSDKMTKLIDDLLNLARLSRQEAKRTAIDMSALAASVVAELREGDPVRSVEISMENGLIASADQSLTEIVLSNLIGNAWKFTSKTAKARIELGTIEKDGKTVYYVKDNGAGFNPQYAATMFQPFRRLHSGEEFEGTGIGLAIVERIIRKHDGKVWAEGEVGKGATVYFNLG